VLTVVYEKPNVMKGVWGLDGVEQFPPAATVNQRKRGIEMKVIWRIAPGLSGLSKVWCVYRVTKGDGGGRKHCGIWMPQNAQSRKVSGRPFEAQADRASVTVEVGRNAG